MTYSQERDIIVHRRLKTWLREDQDGIRRAILTMFLKRSDLTIEEIYIHLSGRFATSYHSVGGMIGIISTRIGVIQGIKDEKSRCRRYRIRDKDLTVVRHLLRS